MSENTKQSNSLRAFLAKHAFDIAAFAGLAGTLILFLIFGGKRLSYNAQTILQTSASNIIISLGAVFVYSMGYMDVSVGQQVGV